MNGTRRGLVGLVLPAAPVAACEEDASAEQKSDIDGGLISVVVR